MVRSKGVVWLVLCCLILVLAGCGGTSQNSSEQNATQKQTQANKITWNAQDLNALTNGNITTAVDVLAPLSENDVKQKAEAAVPASVMKAPWKYYGKIVKVTGEVGIAQEYPPGSDISNAVGGGEVGELVITTEDMTFIDYLHLGSTGEANVGDTVTIYGYPTGIVEVENKLGGTTQELCVVGKLIEKKQ